MKKLFIFIFFLLVTLFFTHTVFATTASNFSFIPFPSRILLDESQKITVQSKNSTGEVMPVSQTYDVFPLSTSVTGEFVSSSGKKISTSTTMNKHTASRTVLYKDSSAGEYTISVALVGREDKHKTILSQLITIASSTVDRVNVAPIISSTSSMASATPLVAKSIFKKLEGTTQGAISKNISHGTSSQIAAVVQATHSVIFQSPPSDITFFHKLFAWPISLCDALYKFVFGE